MIDLKELTEFLVKAKVETYAGDGAEVDSQRPGFKELEFIEGEWEYRDSYSGFYMAPGQEIVRFEGKPIWSMAYSGGITKKYQGNFDFAKQIFEFLKKALKLVDKNKPYRGPDNFKEGDYEYVSRVEGDVSWFKGNEKILFKGEVVFKQDYIGGLIIDKD